MKNQTIRIVSDGTGCGTKIFDANGVEVAGCITRIDWSIDGENQVGVASITFLDVEVDLIGETRDG